MEKTNAEECETFAVNRMPRSTRDFTIVVTRFSRNRRKHVARQTLQDVSPSW
jgi:hypothetical protein